jgi:hypothetical protein
LAKEEEEEEKRRGIHRATTDDDEAKISSEAKQLNEQGQLYFSNGASSKLLLYFKIPSIFQFCTTNHILWPF